MKRRYEYFVHGDSFDVYWRDGDMPLCVSCLRTWTDRNPYAIACAACRGKMHSKGYCASRSGEKAICLDCSNNGEL